MNSVAANGASTLPQLDTCRGTHLPRNTRPLRAGETTLGLEVVVAEWVPLKPNDDPVYAVIRQIIKHLNPNLLRQYGIDPLCFDLISMFNYQPLPPNPTRSNAKVVWFNLKLLPETKRMETSLVDDVLRPRNGRPLRESEYVQIGEHYWVAKAALQHYENVLAARAAGRVGSSSTTEAIQQGASQLTQESCQVAPIEHQTLSAHVDSKTNSQARFTAQAESDSQERQPVIEPAVATTPIHPATSSAEVVVEARKSHPGFQVPAAPIAPTHPATRATDAAIPTPFFHRAASGSMSHPVGTRRGAPPNLLFRSSADSLVAPYVGLTGFAAQSAQSAPFVQVPSVTTSQSNGVHPPVNVSVHHAPAPVPAAPIDQHVAPTIGRGMHTANPSTLGSQTSATTTSSVPETHVCSISHFSWYGTHDQQQQNVDSTNTSLPITSQPQSTTNNVPFAAGSTDLQAHQDATVSAATTGQQLGPTMTGGTRTTNQGTFTIGGSTTGALGPPTQQQVSHGTNNIPPIQQQHALNTAGNLPFGTANRGLQAPLSNVRPFAQFSLPHAAPVLPPPQAAPAAANASVLPSAPMAGVVPTQTINIPPTIVVPPADVDVVMIDAWLLDVYEAAARLLELLSPVVGPRAI